MARLVIRCKACGGIAQLQLQLPVVPMSVNRDHLIVSAVYEALGSGVAPLIHYVVPCSGPYTYLLAEEGGAAA